ncbi:diguanylate cyclase [Anaerolineales bacterium HSG24]|nr:diguanylate cyclase [Anaerolineales bacterium HSG24]
MELKIYLRILLRKWWIVFLSFLITFVVAAYYSYIQPPVYEAFATFLVVPKTAEIRTDISIYSLLSSRSEIPSTYAAIAASNAIKVAAADKLEVPPDKREGLIVQSQVQPGTIVLKIIARGGNSKLVRDFTNQVGQETIETVREHYETFSLEPLDVARAPKNTISPNIPLNLTLGAMVGTILGIGLAFLAVYLEAPTERVSSFGIIDDETGVYNKRYFMQRLAEEMSRAKRNGYPLSVALMNVDHMGTISSSTPQVRHEAMRRVSLMLKPYLREEDVMAHFGSAVFAFLFPDMSGVNTRETLEKLQARFAWTPIELESSGTKLNLSSTAGVVAYRLDDTSKEDLVSSATRALEAAEVAGFGKVQFAEAGNGTGQN